MEVGRRDDGRELPSPMSSSLMHSTMHAEAGVTNSSTAAKLKVNPPLSTGNNGGGGLLGGPGGINSLSRVMSGTSSTPLSTSVGTVGNNHGLSLGVNYSPTILGSSQNKDDLKLPASMELKQKKPVKYRECLKNHAANLGGHATDGCGEYMPSGEEGTLEALTCAACSCHRNFHRREIEGEPRMCSDCRYDRTKALFPSPLPLTSPTLLSPPPHMIMAFNPGGAPADSDEYDTGFMSPHSSSMMKKRFRTKFTPEQKEQMAAFAHKLGWRIQKHDEEAVQQFCAEVGVKRHVLKVWMHNNKLTMAKKVPCCLTMTPENPDMN